MSNTSGLLPGPLFPSETRLINGLLFRICRLRSHVKEQNSILMSRDRLHDLSLVMNEIGGGCGGQPHCVQFFSSLFYLLLSIWHLRSSLKFLWASRSPSIKLRYSKDMVLICTSFSLHSIYKARTACITQGLNVQSDRIMNVKALNSKIACN